ncbi:hypothetical protein C7M84_025508 [Penaeus vannamei]|uniref:Uncharacterized protein n=1 Tax=Penaeus vannamei TaxID=6689 RepID=A0A3R7MN09_PENVA|nr:hypothetical protein C7M84_025508 [Penaeus vannamei]
MYATFEEFIDHQQTSGEGSPASRPSPTGTSGNEAPPPPAPPGGLGAHSPRDVVTSLGSVSSHASASSPSRDVAASIPTSRAHMAEVALPQGAMPSASHGAGSHSPLTARDDLALASPRRRRRPRRLRRSVDNPLLDTISAIGDPDSDEGDLLPPAPPPSASSCWGPRLHPDADVVGYAGSNSVDSGYKSACPTPELPDPSAYLDHRLEKRGSLASLASTGSSSGSGGASKPRIAMGTRVMSRVPRSPSSGGNAPSPGLPRRPGSDGSYYDLDHAMRPPEEPPLGTRTCLVGPPRPPLPSGGPKRVDRIAVLAGHQGAASPRRPPRRLAPPGVHGVASTGGVSGAAAARPLARRQGGVAPPDLMVQTLLPGRGAALALPSAPSPIVGVHDDTDLALLEREIDALLYGGRAGRCDPLAPNPAPDYYDLDSEFAACTCPAFSRPAPSARQYFPLGSGDSDDGDDDVIRPNLPTDSYCRNDLTSYNPPPPPPRSYLPAGSQKEYGDRLGWVAGGS